MRALLDTSVLIGEERMQGVEAAISVASLTELHFGVLIAPDDEERAACTQRLGAIESAFDPLPIGADVAREWGRLAAAVRNRGGQPRRRAIDLAIAATANVQGVPLLTSNVADFHLIRDLVEVRAPSAVQAEMASAMRTEMQAEVGAETQAGIEPETEADDSGEA